MRYPRSKEEFEKNKKHFLEYTLQKKKYSIPEQVLLIIRPRKNWYQGIKIDDLMQKVLSNLKLKGYKKKKISKASIYEAVRDISFYAVEEYGIFIVSTVGLNTKTNKNEFRYHNAWEEDDREHKKVLNERLRFGKGVQNENIDKLEGVIEQEEKLLEMQRELHESRNILSDKQDRPEP